MYLSTMGEYPYMSFRHGPGGGSEGIASPFSDFNWTALISAILRKFSSSLNGNAMHLFYKDKSLNPVYRNNYFAFQESTHNLWAKLRLGF
jgi:hypothetical protein